MEDQRRSRKRLRGFAAMSSERRREAARKGGRTAQARGTAHQWTAEEARAAGQRSARSRKMRPSAAITDDQEKL